MLIFAVGFRVGNTGSFAPGKSPSFAESKGTLNWITDGLLTCLDPVYVYGVCLMI